MESGAELPVTTQEVFKSQEYSIEGAKVQLRWSETNPKEAKNLDPQRAIVWIPAWNWMPDAKIIKGVSQKVADYSGQKVLTISSKTDQLGLDASLTEAKGIIQFIKDQNLSEVIIAGHSEGGMKAADLAVVLEQSEPKVKIDGLVLMDSMGLYYQSPKDLKRNFINDPMKIAAGEFKSTGVKPPSPVSSFMQFARGFWEDIKFFKLKYPQKLGEEIEAMARSNPRLKDIKAPVLIVTGERDYVSDYHKYIPEDINAPLSPDRSKEEQMIERGKARRRYLKENMFPNAEDVAMIVLSKGAHHAGVADIRINQAAHVISKIFDRMKRSSSSK